jgi:hypothetical protein
LSIREIILYIFDELDEHRVGSSGVRNIIVITYCIFSEINRSCLDQFGLKYSCEDVFLIVFSYNVFVSFIVNSNECIFF